MAKYRPPPRLPDPLRKVSLYSSLNLPYGFASNFLVILLTVPFLILPNGGVLYPKYLYVLNMRCGSLRRPPLI